jgi:hypothetical protein
VLRELTVSQLDVSLTDINMDDDKDKIKNVLNDQYFKRYNLR